MTATIQRETREVPKLAEPRLWPADSMVLAATYTALPCTSLLVQHLLRHWQLEMALGQVEAVALQLVCNAVEATGSLDEHLDMKQVDYLNTVVVGLRQTETAVVVEVWDSDQGPPIGPAPAGHQSGYFWLGGGKVVWTAVVYPLPRRKLGAFPYPPVRPEVASAPSQYANDPETVERVRDALEDL